MHAKAKQFPPSVSPLVINFTLSNDIGMYQVISIKLSGEIPLLRLPRKIDKSVSPNSMWINQKLYNIW